MVSGVLGCALTMACTRSVEPAATAQSAAHASAPVPAPRPGILGCVESRELKAFVQALESQRANARRAALSVAGVSPEERRGWFGNAGARLGDTLEVSGKRHVVVAELATHFEPRAAFARRGSVLQRIDERPRAHPVPVLACGVQRCPRATEVSRAPVRPLLVELAPGETWAEEALAIGYDFSWADVRYPEREACEPTPEAASSFFAP